MGLSHRVYLINDDDTLSRISAAIYERLLRRDPKERVQEYAGKRVRYALGILETENRKPWQINRIQYSYLFFDSEGRIRLINRGL